MNTLRKSEALQLIESLKEQNTQQQEQIATLVEAVKALQRQLAIEEAYTSSMELSWRLYCASILNFFKEHELDAYINELKTECSPRFMHEG